jgi:hypothetical protein
MNNREERDIIIEAKDEMPEDKNELMGRFITYRELQEISPKEDFRVKFCLQETMTSDERRVFKIGKQIDTTFFIGGISDEFNEQPNDENSFENFVVKSTSWGLYQTLKNFNGKSIYGQLEIPVYIQDVLDVVSQLLDKGVGLYLSKTKESQMPFIVKLNLTNQLTEYDRFVYYVWYMYEKLLVTCDQQIYTQLEEMFAGSKVPMKWFLDNLSPMKFKDLSQLEEYFASLSLANRRECILYTLKFRDDNLYDSFNLKRLIEKFLQSEKLDKWNYDLIVKRIKNLLPMREVVFRIILTRSVIFDKDDLRAIGLNENLREVEDFEYEIRLVNMLAGTPLDQAFYFSQIIDERILPRKVVELDTYIQYTELEEITKGKFTREELHNYIKQASKSSDETPETSDGTTNYEIKGLFVNNSQIGKTRKLFLYDRLTKELLSTIEFCAKRQPTPRWVVGGNLAVFKLPRKEDSDFQKETSVGLYSHQISFIDNGMAIVTSPCGGTIVYNAVVSAGKTTSVASLARAYSIMNGLLTSPVSQITSPLAGNSSPNTPLSPMAPIQKRVKLVRKSVIYTAWSKSLMKEVLIKCREIGLSVLSSFKAGSGKVVIKSATDINRSDSENVPFNEINKYDILICHPLTLLKHFANIKETDETRILDHVIVVIDELNSGRINSTSEHALSAIIAYKPKNLAILSASIQREKHIQYLRRFGDMKVIESANILTSSSLKCFNGRPIDIFNCTEKQSSVKKILNDTFLRRFVDRQNIHIDDNFVHLMQKRGVFDYSVMLEILQFEKPHIDLTKDTHRPHLYIRDEEILSIKQSNCYTLVLCDNPINQALEIYTSIYESVIKLLTEELLVDDNGVKKKERSFMSKLTDIFGELVDLEEEKANGKFGFGSAIGEFERKKERIAVWNSTRQSIAREETSRSGQLVLPAERPTATQTSFLKELLRDERLDYKHGKDDRDQKKFKEDLKRALVALMDYTIMTDSFLSAIDKLLESKLINEDEKRTIRFIPRNEVISKQEKELEDLIDKKAKLEGGIRNNKETQDLYVNQIQQGITSILKCHSIYHKYDPLINLREIQNWAKDKFPLEYLWKILSIHIEDIHEGLPRIPMNRLFGGEAYCRGIDLPIETTLITHNFGMSVSADTMKQATGRAGRKGKSQIANVVMSWECYDKMFSAEHSHDVEQIILRTNYFVQNQSQNNILERPKIKPSFHRRIDVFIQDYK